MSYTRTQIAPGIFLNLIEVNKFKTNHLALNFIAPLDRSTASLNALLLKVLKRGSAEYPSMLLINRTLDMLYSGRVDSRVFKAGDCQVFGLSLNMLDDAYSLEGGGIAQSALKLLAGLVYSPLIENGAFRADYVESEKKNLRDDIAAKINNKNAYAMERCVEEMCRDEAYSTSELGTPADVDAITPASLYQHYLSVISTLRVEAFFVGTFDREALTASFTEVFSGLDRKDVAEVTTDVVRSSPSSREVVEELPVNQGKLTIGFRSGTVLTDGPAVWAVFALFNELYGGSPNSKLFENVREKLSLCYYCRSVPEAQKGLLMVACGIENTNKQKAQDEILLQLNAIQQGEFDDKALMDGKMSLTNGYREILDSAGAIEMWYLRRAIAGLSDSPEEMAQSVMRVTREEIIEVSKKLTLDTVYFMKGTLAQQEAQADED